MDMQIPNRCMESRFLSDARFRVYVDFAREYGDLQDDRLVGDLALRLYRWNISAASVAFGYISFVEVCVRNAMDQCLKTWISQQLYHAPTDWLEIGVTDPVARIRALINSEDRDYVSEAYKAAQRKQREWRSDQHHPRHGQTVNRDDVFSQLTLGTWDGMLRRSGKDPELAHVLMGAFANVNDAWESEKRRMPNTRLPGNESEPVEDRLRREIVDRLAGIRLIRNRIAHDENLLRVRFPKLRHDMFFILNALDAACPNWAFPDRAVPLKALDPLQVVKDFRISYAFIEKE